jgi:hypothetical protein
MNERHLGSNQPFQTIHQIKILWMRAIFVKLEVKQILGNPNGGGLVGRSFSRSFVFDELLDQQGLTFHKFAS